MVSYSISRRQAKAKFLFHAIHATVSGPNSRCVHLPVASNWHFATFRGSLSSLLKVLLMIGLRVIKFSRGFYLRGNRVYFSFLLLLLRLLGVLALFFVVVVNACSVLCTHIVPLPVCLGRVNLFPKYLAQFPIPHLLRIVRDEDCFRMTRRSTTYLSIRRVLDMALRVSNTRV